MPLRKSLEKPNSESGFIMFNTMITVFMLSVFIIIFGRAVSTFGREAQAQTFQIEFKTKSYSKIYETIFKISQDNPLSDHLQESWNLQNKMGGGFAIKVEDESGKISLLALKSKDKIFRKKIEKSIRKLLSDKGVSADIIDELVAEVKKRKDVPGLESLESYAGASPKEQACLSGFLTVHTDGKININTAARETLEVLLAEENLFLVKEILSRRGKEPFLDLKPFEDTEDSIRSLLSINSSFFTIRISDESYRVFLKVVVQRSLGEIKIVEWMEK